MDNKENNNVVEDQATNNDQKSRQKNKKRKSLKKINQTTGEKKIRRKETFWSFLEHNGPTFPPPHKPLPDLFFYNGKKMKLSPKTEEVATFYAKMWGKYDKNKIFHENFFNDWREVMTDEEKSVIQELGKCNFRRIHHYFEAMRKNLNHNYIRKKKISEEKAILKKQHGFCTVDGNIEEVANFKIEPPGLFNGRGCHPKTGKVKRRVQPEDITINCSKDSKIPEPPQEHKWKEVIHDNTVAWLAKWTDNVLGEDRYIRLSAWSKIKIREEKKKFATAKLLGENIDKIRRECFQDMNSEDLVSRQRAVALYLIDELGLRIGNEKDEDRADTVGCCSLRVEHVTLYEEKEDQKFVVVFYFLGKDSIQYYNEVCVEENIFRNLELFQKDKTPEQNLFDFLTTTKLNDYLNKQMEGLTAKVFRTYNASSIFETCLRFFTDPKSNNTAKIESYKCANLAVALHLNHRKIPKKPILGQKKRITKIKKELQLTLRMIKERKSSEDEVSKMFQSLKGLLFKKGEILLDTSKSNYLDPRITVAWCLQHGIPVEKIFTRKTDRNKFGWAIRSKDAEFCFSAKNE